ncbi:MAG TPA: Asp-tRNA(Asn)/Glu-tRNA(Gln) amidotransferase subunit GatC [Verrucomicrobiae bacterium]|jgi:aspartyl-tRNA(Asn)/glutamyl-tRNA(Gln) amidotransferase subunit C|nr:Asp-tRNA(Asn)/Glu-tRNA(Gln) amidotransferase subunit GatC [Verrucomicrobiae bacterium]
MSFQIDKVAELARIKLKPAEKAKLEEDLKSILAYVEQLRQVDTKNVAETSHVLDLTNVFRKDEVKPSEVRDSVLESAPARQGKFFKVPKVVER